MSSSAQDGLHPVELSVYSLLSTDLDGINQSINELRGSQVILILKLREIRESLKREYNLLYEAEDMREATVKLEDLKKRTLALEQRFKVILDTAKNLK